MKGKPLLQADFFTECWTRDPWHREATGQLITPLENVFLLTVVIPSEAPRATHWCTKETCVRQAVSSLGYHPPKHWIDPDWAGLWKKSQMKAVKLSQVKAQLWCNSTDSKLCWQNFISNGSGLPGPAQSRAWKPNCSTWLESFCGPSPYLGNQVAKYVSCHYLSLE